MRRAGLPAASGRAPAPAFPSGYILRSHRSALMRAMAEMVIFLVVCALLWFGCFYIAPAVIEAYPAVVAQSGRN
jgi:hypothetical protein